MKTGYELALRSQVLRKIIVLVMLSVPTLIVVLATGQKANIVRRDFISYWASGRLLAAGHNPYDRKAVLQLERSQGFHGSRVMLARNPPWALWWMLPLGFVSLETAWALWIATCVSALAVSIHLCWRMYGRGDPDVRSLFLLWTVGFAPVLACLMLGQAGLLLLVGLVAFLHLESTHPFWAGLTLILPLAKPHLIAPFLLLVLIGAVRERKWTLAAGFLTGMCAVILPVSLIDRHLWANYQTGIVGENIGGDFVPTLSCMFRALLCPNMLWVQFMPLLGGLIWATWSYFKASSWNWRIHGLPILVTSVLVTPYAWFTDEVILLPVMLWVGLRINSQKNSRAATGALLVGSTILLLMVMAAVPITSGLYFWSVLTWSGWYWLGCEGRQFDLVVA